ncbi:TPA: hypothetical protein ACGO00_001433 [Streptococcus suis]|nr:hypothetical protein [Streptococcus suis]
MLSRKLRRGKKRRVEKRDWHKIIATAIAILTIVIEILKLF